MKIIRASIALCILLTCSAALASPGSLPAPFEGQTADSKFEIQYDDLDAFLKAHVYVVGRSNREKAPRPKSSVGTKLKARINRLTALEGNRFYFESFEQPEIREILTSLRTSLENLPNEIPLNYLSREEQLAYWLNLYNFTLLDELAKYYPSANTKNFLDYGEEDSILARKVLNVAGIPLSLDDIQFTILKEKYHSEPVVIYGLFQGNIASPNILSKAFTGKNVWHMLEANAADFINSNRGTYYEGGKDVRVSAIYERNMAFFDNNPEKLREHLLSYLEDDLYAKVADASEFEADISDWNFADLLGTQRNYGGAYHTNTAALLNSVRALHVGGDDEPIDILQSTYIASEYEAKSKLNMRFSPEQLDMLRKIKHAHELNSGTVDIKDLEDDEGSEDN